MSFQIPLRTSSTFQNGKTKYRIVNKFKGNRTNPNKSRFSSVVETLAKSVASLEEESQQSLGQEIVINGLKECL